jgi:hypothetical protein
MLCHACHVHLRGDYPYCLKYETLREGAKLTQFAAPELHVGDENTVWYRLRDRAVTVARRLAAKRAQAAIQVSA